MACIENWLDEMYTTFRTASYGSETMTEGSSPAPSSLLPYKTAMLFLGVVGTLTNGFVLGGFWLSDRSKMTPSSVHIANHTTLELHTFPLPSSWLRTFLTYVDPHYYCCLPRRFPEYRCAILLTLLRPGPVVHSHTTIEQPTFPLPWPSLL